MYAVLPTFKFQLEHYNSFYLKGTKDFTDVFNPEFTIQFIYNTKRNISQLKMYSQKEPIEFNKVISAKEALYLKENNKIDQVEE